MKLIIIFLYAYLILDIGITIYSILESKKDFFRYGYARNIGKTLVIANISMTVFLMMGMYRMSIPGIMFYLIGIAVIIFIILSIINIVFYIRCS